MADWLGISLVCAPDSLLAGDPCPLRSIIYSLRSLRLSGSFPTALCSKRHKLKKYPSLIKHLPHTFSPLKLYHFITFLPCDFVIRRLADDFVTLTS